MTSRYFLTVEEVAQRLNLHVRTVRRHIRDGRLKAKRIGKEYRVTRTDFESFAGGGERPEDAIPRTRQVSASTIVDVDVISPAESDRVTTMLMAALNAGRDGGEASRVDSLYYPERGRLRITIVAGPVLTSELLRLIAAQLDGTRGERSPLRSADAPLSV